MTAFKTQTLVAATLSLACLAFSASAAAQAPSQPEHPNATRHGVSLGVAPNLPAYGRYVPVPTYTDGVAQVAERGTFNARMRAGQSNPSEMPELPSWLVLLVAAFCAVAVHLDLRRRDSH